MPKWQASFFQEKQCLPLPIKDLPKIVLAPYQTHRHLPLEGHLKVNWCDSPLGVSVSSATCLMVSRECLNTLRTIQHCLLGHLWHFPSSFSYLLRLGWLLYTLWPHRPCPSLFHPSPSKMPPPGLPFCKSCQSLCTYKKNLTTEALLFLLLSLFCFFFFKDRFIWFTIIPKWLLLQITRTALFFCCYIISNTESWL